MTDFTVSLAENVFSAYSERVNSDEKLAKLAVKAESDKATFEDVHRFAIRLGEVGGRAVADAFMSEFVEELELYYGTVADSMLPVFRDIHKRVSPSAQNAQRNANRLFNVPLNALPAEFPEAYAHNYVNDITNDGVGLLERTVPDTMVKMAQGVVDMTIKRNMREQALAGLNPKIRRVNTGSRVCDTCRSLNGTWDYYTAPEDIFLRHRYCKCLTIYIGADGEATDVHSKKTWSVGTNVSTMVSDTSKSRDFMDKYSRSQRARLRRKSK